VFLFLSLSVEGASSMINQNQLLNLTLARNDEAVYRHDGSGQLKN
jgi:hypothetical protein